MNSPLVRIVSQFKMWCFISEPNGIIHELVLSRDSVGAECLEKVCAKLHVVEKDYFGLRYKSPSSNAETWLNLRNRLCDQLVGKAPYRLRLTVKYYVKPQELQQAITRDLFYSSVYQNLIDGHYKLSSLDAKTLVYIISLIAQVEFGNHRADLPADYQSLLPCWENWSAALQKLVEADHQSLEGATASEAKVKLLQQISELPEYGTEVFYVTSCCSNSELKLVIRHDGLRVYNAEHDQSPVEHSCSAGDPSKICLNEEQLKETSKEDCSKFIPYEDISTVSYRGKKFTIIHGVSSEPFRLSFRLTKNQNAISLFRAFTEYHSFYQCSVVKNSVLDKSTRNSLGRFASLFKRGAAINKLYLFDIIRTRRQAYNHAWSELNAPDKKRQSFFYHSDRHWNRKSASISDPTVTVQSIASVKSRQVVSSDCEFFQPMEKKNRVQNPRCQSMLEDISGHLVAGNSSNLSVTELREAVNTLIDSRMCQICMDAVVATAFCPCGHIVCCVDCSEQCKECPLCRTQITYAQRVFFPSQ